MPSPYVGEIRMFAGNFAPVEWLLCQGQQLPISEYDLLFHFIGTTYGGDGQSTFQLPDLRSRVPIHMGQGEGLPYYVQGQTGGAESVTLTTATMAQHSHGLQASASQAASNFPSECVTATSPSISLYYEDAPSTTVKLNPQAVRAAGGGGAHENVQPFLVINFIISLFGAYPPPN